MAFRGEVGVNLFPMFLKLEGRRCLVVGAGPVGEEKIFSLLSCGASVRVVAPRATPGVEALSRDNRIEWQARRFVSRDLDGMEIAIAATGDVGIDRSVFAEAAERSVLCNTVDSPALCDFYFGSIVRRGGLQIAISTAGKSPALAQRLRREIDASLAPDAGRWLEDIGSLRGELLQAAPGGEERKAALHRLAEREVCDAPQCPARLQALAHLGSDDGSDDDRPRREAGAPADPHRNPRPRAAQAGKVYLVGAGPGDPDLLTLKAARLLREADVVLHDDLVPQAILDLARSQALVVSVGKRCGKKRITQAAIHELMIGSARRNLAVVRLKSGDPMIFGRAGEEMDALRQAGVPFEAVPGITAASSAAASLSVSLTDRRVASGLLVLSGHCSAEEAAGRSGEAGANRWPESLPRHHTLAIYMPGRELAAVAGALLRAGVDGDTPCAVASDASRADAAYSICTVSTLAGAGVSFAPRLVLVGEVFAPLLAPAGAPSEDCAKPEGCEREERPVASPRPQG